MKTNNDAIKAIKYLKSQFYKVQSQKQKDGLNKAIMKHEAILQKIHGKDAFKEYLTTKQSADLPEKMNMISIDSDADMVDGTVQMYKDGATLGTMDDASIGVNITLNKIGNSLTASHGFDGMIDEVMIYEKALDADEIDRNYKAGKRSHR